MLFCGGVRHKILPVYRFMKKVGGSKGSSAAFTKADLLYPPETVRPVAANHS